MELACESVDFERTLEYKQRRDPSVNKIVLNAGEPHLWVDQQDIPRTVVPATSMEVSRHKKLCSIVVYGQVLVTAKEADFAALPGHFVHKNPGTFPGKETHEFFMTSPY